MRDLSSREKWSVALSLIVVIGGIFYYGVLLPSKEAQEAAEQKADGLKRKLIKEQQLIEQSLQITASYEEYVRLFVQEFSDDEQMSAIIAEIETVARQINLRFSQIKPDRVKNEEFYNIFAVNLTAEGKMEELTRFFYLLQNRPHLFAIKQLRLEKDPDNTSQLKAHLIVHRSLIPEEKKN